MCDKDCLCRNGLGAELATLRFDWDVAQALRAGFCYRRRWSGMELSEQVLGGQDEEEIDDGGEDEEVDDGGEEVAVADLASVDVTEEIAEVGLADDGSQ